jgi:tetratricopeptide (TPR) repeat protein
MRTSLSRSVQGASLVFAVLCITLLGGCGSPEQRSQSYFDQGMALLAKNDDLNARVALTTSLKFNSNRIEAWRALAGIDERTKDSGGLFRDLRRIVELDEGDIDARLKLARIMFANNGGNAALKLLDAAGDADKSRADLHALRAVILLKANDAAAAVKEAEQAVKIEPGNPEATLVLASERFSRGDLDGALQRLNTATSKDDPKISLLKVQIFAKKGDLPQAEAILKKLVETQPQLRGQLVQLYIGERHFDDAEKELRSLSAAAPTDSKTGMDLVRFLVSFRGANSAKDELSARIKAGGDVFPYQMALVDLDYAQGNIADSTALLDTLVKTASSPEHVVAAKVRLAEIEVSRKDFAAAEPIIADILAKDRRNTDGLRLRAAIRLERGQIDNGIADLREALNDQPKSPDLLLLMATAYERGGKPELADRQYADALKSSGLAPAVGLRYSSYLRNRGDNARAEEVLLQVVGRSSGNIQILYALAQVRLARKNWTGALAVADVVRSAGNIPFADEIKAAALSGQNKPDASIAALEDAHAAAPDAVQPVTLLVGVYLRTGKPDKAETLLRDMLQRFPSNAALLVLLGQTQSARGKTDEAQKSFKAAITLQPKEEVGYSALSGMYAVQKKYSEANDVIQAGLKERPDSLDLRLTSAQLSIRKGDIDAAITGYEAILKDQPNSLLAVNNLASLLLDNRADKPGLERATELAERLKNSSVPQFEDTYGWAQYKRGNLSDAVKILEGAVGQLPNLAALRYHLGMSYAAVGQAAKAAEQLKTAFALEPDGTDLKEKIRAAMK